MSGAAPPLPEMCLQDVYRDDFFKLAFALCFRMRVLIFVLPQDFCIESSLVMVVNFAVQTHFTIVDSGRRQRLQGRVAKPAAKWKTILDVPLQKLATSC